MADFIDFDVDALEDMAYKSIQALCKQIGVRANQKVSPSTKSIKPSIHRTNSGLASSRVLTLKHSPHLHTNRKLCS
jgi:hypothetical protein